MSDREPGRGDVPRWACDPADVDWSPLERFVAHPVAVAARVTADAFMWMGTVGSSGRLVHLYKHVGTRGYLRLDAEAIGYVVVDGELVRSGSVSESLTACRR